MQRIISQTPLRISLFGGGTDYPAYYKRKKGATLGLTINKYTYVSLNTISPFFDYKLRVSYSKIEFAKKIEEILHPSVRCCLQHKKIDLPLDIHISSDLPARTGLGSSSSFTVGFLNALSALQGKIISKQKLAEEACYVEQTLIGENVGSQDQFHAAFGGLNIFEFNESEITSRSVITSAENKKSLQDHLLIFYTGLTRYATEVLQEQVEKTKALKNDSYLDRLYELTFEAEEILSESSSRHLPQLLGNLLQEGWSLKKKLSNQISNSFIDLHYEKAIASGAYGGKLCGAGGGGFLIFLAPPEKRGKIRQELKELAEVPVSLESLGSNIIYIKE